MSRRSYAIFLTAAIGIPAVCFGLYVAGAAALERAVPPGTPPGLASAGVAFILVIGLVVGIGHPRPR